MSRQFPRSLALLGAASLLFSAACSSGDGSASGTAGSTPAPTVEEEEPEAVTASLAWVPAEGPVDGYRVLVSRDGGPYETLPDVFAEANADVDGEVGERIRIRVAALDDMGTVGPPSEPSAEILLTEEGPVLAPPAATVAQQAPEATSASLPEPGGSAAAPDDDETETDAGTKLAVRGDLDGDGAAELVWVSDGKVLATSLDGESLASLLEAARPDGDWEVAGFGDFEGDGNPDLLWLASDGILAHGPIDGSALTTLGVLEISETVASIADLNGDGTSDLIVEDSELGTWAWWQLAAGAAPKLVELAPPTEGARVTTSGDYDGDGRDDLAWRAADGSLHVDFMLGSVVVGSSPIAYAATALGSGDFDGDGVTDLLVRDGSGTLLTLAMNDRSEPAEVAGPVDAGASYDVASVADYDGDGLADVIWNRAGSRMLRLTGQDAADLPIDAGSDWQLIPFGV